MIEGEDHTERTFCLNFLAGLFGKFAEEHFPLGDCDFIKKVFEDVMEFSLE